jgi:hypothetical protein
MNREIMMQAVNEVCEVTTEFGTRRDLRFLDCDSTHAMFAGFGNVVIININHIKSLEYKDEEDRDRKHIRNKDSEVDARKTNLQNVQ